MTSVTAITACCHDAVAAGRRQPRYLNLHCCGSVAASSGSSLLVIVIAVDNVVVIVVLIIHFWLQLSNGTRYHERY